MTTFCPHRTVFATYAESLRADAQTIQVMAEKARDEGRRNDARDLDDELRRLVARAKSIEFLITDADRIGHT